jgi:signal recognition particle subunit SRP72
MAEKYISYLPDMSLPQDVNLDQLESFSEFMKPLSSSSKPAPVKAVKKRKRKPILPKSYDPNATPDPERWLPKRDRSSYQKKLRSVTKKDFTAGSQGVALPGGLGGTGSARIGRSMGSAPSPSSEATSPKESLVNAAPETSSQQNKKKKKKGKK